MTNQTVRGGLGFHSFIHLNPWFGQLRVLRKLLSKKWKSVVCCPGCIPQWGDDRGRGKRVKPCVFSGFHSIMVTGMDLNVKRFLIELQGGCAIMILFQHDAS